MLTKDIRQTIDNARDVLVGKIPNPQSQIEQITIAMIYKFMDDMDSESVEFGGERQYFVKELEKYSWTKVMSSQLGNDDRMKLYKEALEKLPLSEQIPKLFRNIFKGAYLPYNDSKTLTLFLKEIDDLSYNNSENLGNGFEYLLSIMGSQGDAGMFRTPRHIIDFIVNVVQPKKTDTILDPACGTAGFLISAYKYILQDAKEHNQILTPTELTTLTENIQGYDISPDMVKLALVNMYLHKFKDPKIYEYDTLTNLNRWEEYFDCILANPPFMTPKGGIQPHNKFGVKANRSEVLFVDYIMEHINSTGKAGIVVPEGIVFQSGNAYKELRKRLVDDKYLYAVVSLPSGVFNPYAGVKTSILFLDKQLAKKTDKILFVEVKQDGYDLGAQRRETPDKNDMPEALELIHKWQDSINAQTEFTTESKLVTIVEKSKLSVGGEYNLTASRYKETQDYSNCKWEMVKLGDERLFTIESGGTPSSNVENYWNGDINWVTLADIPVSDSYTTIKSTNRTITQEGLNKSSAKLLPVNSVLISSRATIGRIAINTVELATNQGFKNIVIKDFSRINPQYIAYTMRKLVPKMESMATGGTFKEISKSSIMTLEIPLPPLEVQEEIVRELDGYQAVIDGAKKVVDNWKPTLPINPNWETYKLNDVCNQITDGTHSTPTYTETGVPFLRVTDITETNDSKKFISEEEHQILIKRCRPEKGDVLYTKNGTIGIAKMVDWDWEFSIFVSLCLLKPKREILSPQYLTHFLNSRNALEQAYAHSKANVITNLHLVEIKSFDIPIPSLEEQAEVVAKIEEEEKAIEECKKLIKLYQDKIDAKIKSIWGEQNG